MKLGTAHASPKRQQAQNNQDVGMNLFLIAGGVFLSTISIQILCKLKQNINLGKSTTNTDGLSPSDQCDVVEIKQPWQSSISVLDTSKENTSLVSSAECLDNPQILIHDANGVEPPCFCGSSPAIFNNRELMYKMRKQLKQRDEMIFEMQAKITDLQNALTTRVSHSAHLQSQLDRANKELFDWGRDIQRVREVVADHWLEVVGSLMNQVTARNEFLENKNVTLNGLCNELKTFELHPFLDKVMAVLDEYESLKKKVG